MKKYLTRLSLQYKFCCDGFDLLDHELFNLSDVEKQYIINHTRFDIDNWQHLAKFYQYSIDNLHKYYDLRKFFLLNLDLCKKYEIGLFRVSDLNNWHDSYILFNIDQLNIWKKMLPNIINLEFMVCFSRDLSGKINGVGLRLLDDCLGATDFAFKWLFPFGQNCTFGLNLVSVEDEIILVEGFTDMIAGRESGYNTVGLGSINITNVQLNYLNHLKYGFCPDGDEYGQSLLNSADNIEFYEFLPKSKDPYESFIKYGKIQFNKIKNKEKVCQ